MKVSSAQSVKCGDIGYESSCCYEGSDDEEVKQAHIKNIRASMILKYFACAGITIGILCGIALTIGQLNGDAAPAA